MTMTSRFLLAATSTGLSIFALATDPFTEPDSAVVRAFLGAGSTTGVLLVLAGAGVVLAVFGLDRVGRRALTAVALVEVLGLGVALQSVSTIALAGYLLAMALPFGLLVLVVQAVRRYRRLRWMAIALLAAVGAIGVRSGLLAPDHLTGLARDLGEGFATHAAQLLFVVVLAGATVAWALVLAGSAGHGPAVAAFGGWVRRHRTGITLVAAAGPLPYALVRASWLTPWPLLVPGSEMLDPEIRLWGLLLGGAAGLGSVLTLGLLRPWGTTFPRWVPRCAGRPVPVRVAVVPAGLVAGMVCAAAAPMLRGILAAAPGTVFGGLPVVERLIATLVFPFWIWGPALALAAWGYRQVRSEARPAIDPVQAPDFASAGE